MCQKNIFKLSICKFVNHVLLHDLQFLSKSFVIHMQGIVRMHKSSWGSSRIIHWVQYLCKASKAWHNRLVEPGLQQDPRPPKIAQDIPRPTTTWLNQKKLESAHATPRLDCSWRTKCIQSGKICFFCSVANGEMLDTAYGWSTKGARPSLVHGFHFKEKREMALVFPGGSFWSLSNSDPCWPHQQKWPAPAVSLTQLWELKICSKAWSWKNASGQMFIIGYCLNILELKPS